jgi:hypothetical protein
MKTNNLSWALLLLAVVVILVLAFHVYDFPFMIVARSTPTFQLAANSVVQVLDSTDTPTSVPVIKTSSPSLCYPTPTPKISPTPYPPHPYGIDQKSWEYLLWARELQKTPYVEGSACKDGCAVYLKGCGIKAIINQNNGEKVYLLPGSKFYDQVAMNPGCGDRWFCTETEAQAKGFQKSR